MSKRFAAQATARWFSTRSRATCANCEPEELDAAAPGRRRQAAHAEVQGPSPPQPGSMPACCQRFFPSPAAVRVRLCRRAIVRLHPPARETSGQRNSVLTKQAVPRALRTPLPAAKPTNSSVLTAPVPSDSAPLPVERQTVVQLVPQPAPLTGPVRQPELDQPGLAPRAQRPAALTGPLPVRQHTPLAGPAWKKDDRPARPPARFGAGSTGESRPTASRSFTPKPAWKKPERSERTARPDFKRPAAPRREFPAREARVFDEDLGPVRPPNLHIEEIPAERPGQSRPFQARPSAPRSSYSRPTSDRTSGPRSYSDRSRPSRPSFDGPRSSARPGSAKPFRSEGGMSRPFSTSSGKPRAGGARPSSKPGSFKPSSGARASADSRPSYGAKRPFKPRDEGSSDYRPTKAKPYPGSASRAERKAGPGWKPKPSFGAGKPASGSHSRPKPGGFSKSGFKGKPGGAKRTGSRPGGKKRG